MRLNLFIMATMALVSVVLLAACEPQPQPITFAPNPGIVSYGPTVRVDELVGLAARVEQLEARLAAYDAAIVLPSEPAWQPMPIAITTADPRDGGWVLRGDGDGMLSFGTTIHNVHPIYVEGGESPHTADCPGCVAPVRSAIGAGR